MKDFDRIVVVTAQHGEKFIGWVPEGEDPAKYMESPTVLIKNARLLATQQQPKFDARQNVVGVSVLVAMIPIDMFPSAMPNLRVHPSSWYFPFENRETEKKIEQLLAAAERNEGINRAIDAGLSVPGVG